MVAAVGSGSVLFTPRIGARYGYEFLWMALIFIFLMWVMIREVGRYNVVTGKTIFEGYRDISGKSNWSLYFILVPQILAAVVTIAGIAALAGSAMMIVLPWQYEAYAATIIVLCLIIVLTGTYKTFERIMSIMAGVLVFIVVVTAFRVLPDSGELGQGIVPAIPENIDIEFVLPWVGFILAGASGIMWFSYWVSARKYGGELTREEEVNKFSEEEEQEDIQQSEEVYAQQKSWIKTLTVTSAIGVVGGGIVLLSFLVLGAELLRPQGLIPEGIDVAKDLTRLLSQVWGEIGKWVFVTGIMIALLGTILSNQDGYGRMFADGTVILLMPLLKKKELVNPGLPDTAEDKAKPRDGLDGRKKKITSFLLDKKKLRVIYAIVLGAALPLVAFFIVRDPVEILSIAGTVAAVHTPVVVFLTLHLNRNRLPKPLRPGGFVTVAMWLSGIAYGAFAVYHFATLSQ